MKVEYSKKEIYGKDLKKVNQVLKSGWLTHGIFTDEFEKEFCKYTGSKYCVTVSSCTAGLHLSCIVAGFKKGDEVIVPAMTHVATAHAVEHTGAKAVIADIDPKTGNLDLENIKKMYIASYYFDCMEEILIIISIELSSNIPTNTFGPTLFNLSQCAN